jgi:hypothetical protein
MVDILCGTNVIDTPEKRTSKLLTKLFDKSFQLQQLNNKMFAFNHSSIWHRMASDLSDKAAIPLQVSGDNKITLRLI